MAARKPPVSALPQITAAEVQAAKKACAESRRLYRAQQASERARDAALSQLFFKMGMTLEEVKGMSPERLSAEIQRRDGISFSFATDAREFTILKTWEGRRPDWKSHFLTRVGPAIAAEIEKGTRAQYSYAVIDPPAEVQPGIAYIPKRAS
jgi:hypothetical protein